jgi:hypothetical protein
MLEMVIEMPITYKYRIINYVTGIEIYGRIFDQARLASGYCRNLNLDDHFSIFDHDIGQYFGL